MIRDFRFRFLGFIYSLVATHISFPLQCGVPPSDIGIIAPYQQQVRLLRDLMREHHLVDVEVNTVDQYQGRDKAAIFMSFVKSRQEDGSVRAVTFWCLEFLGGSVIPFVLMRYFVQFGFIPYFFWTSKELKETGKVYFFGKKLGKYRQILRKPNICKKDHFL